MKVPLDKIIPAHGLTSMQYTVLLQKSYPFRMSIGDGL